MNVISYLIGELDTRWKKDDQLRAVEKIIVRLTGPRPPFYCVARALWGDRDFDSDGNSRHPDDNEWTELTLVRRPNYDQRIDIDPVDAAHLIVSSIEKSLAEAVVDFLVAQNAVERIE